MPKDEDQFYLEILKSLTKGSPNKDLRFQIVSEELIKMLRFSQEIKNPRFIRNATVLMLSFLNDLPIDGFNPGNISCLMNNDKEEILETLRNEFMPN